MSSMPEPENPPCCPGEEDCPAGAPGAVGGEEDVIRFIPDEKWLVWVDGAAIVTRSAFPEKELKTKNPQETSCSLGRKDKMLPEEILSRGNKRNRRKQWDGDPVIAKASVITLRDMEDTDGRRQACVYADPISKSEDLDEDFVAHAYLRRGDPIPDVDRKMDMAVFRRTLASKFNTVTHHSGKSVEEPV